MDIAQEVARAIRVHRDTDWSLTDPLTGGFTELAMAVAKHGRAALDVVAPYLESRSAEERAGAAYLLGRIGEEDRKELGPLVRAHLLDRAVVEDDPEALHAVAVAVSHSGLGRAEAMMLCREQDPRLRRIGAYHLAMTVGSDQEDEPVRRLLTSLIPDVDPDVQDWARFGLDTLDT